MRILEIRKQTKTLILGFVIFLGLGSQFIIKERSRLVHLTDELNQLRRGNPENERISEQILIRNLLRTPFCGQAFGHFHKLKFGRDKKVKIWIGKANLSSKPQFITFFSVNDNDLFFEHGFFGQLATYEFKAQKTKDPDHYFLILKNRRLLLSPRLCPKATRP